MSMTLNEYPTSDYSIVEMNMNEIDLVGGAVDWEGVAEGLATAA